MKRKIEFEFPNCPHQFGSDLWCRQCLREITMELKEQRDDLLKTIHDIREGCAFPSDEVQKAIVKRCEAAIAAAEKTEYVSDTDRRKLELWPEIVKALDIAFSWIPKDTSMISGARNYMLTAASAEIERVLAKAAELEEK